MACNNGLFGGNSCCSWIIILLILSMCCGGEGGLFGGGNHAEDKVETEINNTEYFLTVENVEIVVHILLRFLQIR
jgi:hypothetical protein